MQIVEGPIEFASLCEHHVLPFIGQAYIGCFRHEKIIGLSKFTRIVRKYARRFSVQERIAQEVAGQAIAAKVIDEFFLTVSPQIVGRQTIAQRPSIAGETLFLPETAPWFELRSVKRAFDHLLLRYTSLLQLAISDPRAGGV